MSLKENDEYWESRREANEDKAKETLKKIAALIVLKYDILCEQELQRQQEWWHQENEDEEWIEHNG